jgi:hypothetical protein
MSYSWRSILGGLEIVKKGMIWRVSDGAGLSIWSDPWIPRDFSRDLSLLADATYCQKCQS